MAPRVLFLAVLLAACAQPRGPREPDGTSLTPPRPRAEWLVLAGKLVDPALLAVRDKEIFQAREELAQFFPDEQPHLLRAVRKALDDPLGIPARARQQADALLFERGLPRAPQPYGVAALPEGRPEPLKGLEVLDERVAFSVTALYKSLAAATAEWELALEKLTPDDRAFLREHLPRFLARSTPEDQERAQKGIEDVAGREAMMRCAALWAKVDQSHVAQAWFHVEHGIDSALDDLALQKKFDARELKIDTPQGPILLRGTQNGGGEDDALLVIDFGGHDEHRMPDTPTWRPIRVVIDVAGDDIYLSNAAHSWGGALLGISVLVDRDGNDDYRAGDWGLGCGLGGIGVLWDAKGRDRYYGGLGVCGAAIFGKGWLIDDEGNDEYACGLFGQGFASTGGAGTLIDRNGNDTYLAGRDDEDIWRRKATYITFAQGSAYGHRFGHIFTDEAGQRRWKMTGQLPGGVGMLVDGGGNDTYQADVFGQGAGYWYSLGLLVDLSGNDHYRTTWYGQGVGTHMAAGCVVDAHGNDFYLSRNTSQGCGHDFSVGILLDESGDDEYRSMALSQGAGNAFNALGLLVDSSGNDRYHCGPKSWGFGSDEKRKPELSPYGIFLDLAGDDRYEGRDAPEKDKDGRWRQGERGFGRDRN